MTSFKNVTVEKMGTLPTGTRIIDVRQPDEFTGELGHLSGAELVPLEQLESAAAGWDRGAPLLMVCRSGNRSGRAASSLVQMGFADVSNLAGGMMAVRAAGVQVA